jgi:PAS domain S-box-containing protein
VPNLSSPPSEGSAATRYGGALICAAAALLLRLILQPLLGDAAFHVFTLAVVASALWGLGPALLATLVSAAAGQLLLHPDAPFAAETLWADPRAALFVCEGVLLATGIAIVRRSARETWASGQAHTELELRAAAADMRAVLDSALDAVIGMDEQGTVTFWNPRAVEIFGWTQAEAQGRNLAELVIRPADRDAFREGLAQFPAGGEWPWLGRRMELLALRRDRSHFPVEISVVARKRGQRWQFNVFVADITERKRNEERVLVAEQDARRAAEDANRMKDEFLATVSHELRTPLSAIVGWAQVLREGGLSGADVERAVASIDRNARAQSQLISDLLDVTRIVSGKLRLELQALNPVHVVDAAADTVRPTADAKGVTLEISAAPGLPPVQGDLHRLQQVVWNLIANAVKFTPKDGRVRVRVEPLGGEVAIAVEDTGQGINPEFLPHVFERFRQAEGASDRTHGGLGLGLAIARQLAQLHGGDITAESDGVGRGARFTIRLPAMQTLPAPPPDPLPRPTAGAQPPARNYALVR